LTRLALHALTKRFGSVTAVAPLTLELGAGSIHGILGENGAGKTTLVEMIAGTVAPDGGTVAIDGRLLPPGDARAARRAGVGVVHQHFALIGALSVAENLFLGRADGTRRLVRPGQLADDARALASAHGIDIGDPRLACRELPVGALARVEILRALSGEPRVLLLDEPTAVLTPPEVAELFTTLRRLRDGGMLILFITHKLAEAMSLCDRLTVLRGGHVVESLTAAETSPREIAALMVGGSADGVLAPESRRADADTGSADAGVDEQPDPMLSVRALATPAARRRSALTDVAFELAAGEIRGIAGVDGNGQDELAGALYGTTPRAGQVRLGGRELPAYDVRAAQNAGMALLPADRQRDGLALALDVWENVLLAAPILSRFARRGWIDRAGARGFAARLARDYRVVLATIEQPVGELSGGNQQRIVIGRALAMRPLVLVAQNPTRGLDVAAAAHVHATLRRVAAAGTAVLLISTDLDEVLALATRVHVLYRGRLLPPVAAPDRTRLGRLMAGLDA
jgi:simple sugar transport system ATP-binding protein